MPLNELGHTRAQERFNPVSHLWCKSVVLDAIYKT